MMYTYYILCTKYIQWTVIWAVSAQRSDQTRQQHLLSLMAAQDGLWIYCMCKFLQEAIQVQQEWSPRHSIYDATP